MEMGKINPIKNNIFELKKIAKNSYVAHKIKIVEKKIL